MNNGIINDIASTIGSGLTPLRSNDKYWDIPCYPWLKTEQLGEFQIFDTNEYVSQAALDETSIKLWPPKTLSVAMYGEGQTRGNTSIIMREMTTNQACCNIVVDEGKADYRYVYYWMKKSYLQLRILASGVRKNLNSDDIKTFPISYPSLPIQTCIADVLFCLDKKIALNKRINAELEAMAKTLYDYWFVQFDFPDENGKPYRTSGGAMEWNEQLKREIPKGWKMGNLYNIADYINGLACQKYRPMDEADALPVIKIKEMHDGITRETEYVSTSIPQKNKIFTGDILFSWSATLEVMYWFGNNGGLNQHIFKVVPIGYFSKEYVYHQLSAYVVNFVQMAEARKTTMGHITTDHLQQSRIVLPPQKVICSFTEIMKPLHLQIQQCCVENDELTRLRDWLLPMLMNGQATVSAEKNSASDSNIVELPKTDDERFSLWLQKQGIAARGELDKKTLRDIFDAMDDDDK